MIKYLASLIRSIPIARSRLLRDKSGVAMLEFALVALPFFAIIGAILEVGLLFITEEILNNAFLRATRAIRLGGSAYVGKSSIEQQKMFIQSVCAKSILLIKCDRMRAQAVVHDPATSGLTVDLSRGLPDQASLNFYHGNRGDLIVLRLFYAHPLILNRLGLRLNFPGTSYHLMAFSTAFRNEM